MSREADVFKHLDEELNTPTEVGAVNKGEKLKKEKPGSTTAQVESILAAAEKRTQLVEQRAGWVKEREKSNERERGDLKREKWGRRLKKRPNSQTFEPTGEKGANHQTFYPENKQPKMVGSEVSENRDLESEQKKREKIRDLLQLGLEKEEEARVLFSQKKYDESLKKFNEALVIYEEAKKIAAEVGDQEIISEVNSFKQGVLQRIKKVKENLNHKDERGEDEKQELEEVTKDEAKKYPPKGNGQVEDAKVIDETVDKGKKANQSLDKQQDFRNRMEKIKSEVPGSDVVNFKGDKFLVKKVVKEATDEQTAEGQLSDSEEYNVYKVLTDDESGRVKGKNEQELIERVVDKEQIIKLYKSKILGQHVRQARQQLAELMKNKASQKKIKAAQEKLRNVNIEFANDRIQNIKEKKEAQEKEISGKENFLAKTLTNEGKILNEQLMDERLRILNRRIKSKEIDLSKAKNEQEKNKLIKEIEQLKENYSQAKIELEKKGDPDFLIKLKRILSLSLIPGAEAKKQELLKDNQRQDISKSERRENNIKLFLLSIANTRGLIYGSLAVPALLAAVGVGFPVAALASGGVGVLMVRRIMSAISFGGLASLAAEGRFKKIDEAQLLAGVDGQESLKKLKEMSKQTTGKQKEEIEKEIAVREKYEQTCKKLDKNETWTLAANMPVLKNIPFLKKKADEYASAQQEMNKQGGVKEEYENYFYSKIEKQAQQMDLDDIRKRMAAFEQIAQLRGVALQDLPGFKSYRLLTEIYRDRLQKEMKKGEGEPTAVANEQEVQKRLLAVDGLLAEKMEAHDNEINKAIAQSKKQKMKKRLLALSGAALGVVGLPQMAFGALIGGAVEGGRNFWGILTTGEGDWLAGLKTAGQNIDRVWAQNEQLFGVGQRTFAVGGSYGPEVAGSGIKQGIGPHGFDEIQPNDAVIDSGQPLASSADPVVGGEAENIQGLAGPKIVEPEVDQPAVDEAETVQPEVERAAGGWADNVPKEARIEAGSGQGPTHAFVRQIEQDPTKYGLEADASDRQIILKARQIAVDNNLVKVEDGQTVGEVRSYGNEAYVLKPDGQGGAIVEHYDGAGNKLAIGETGSTSYIENDREQFVYGGDKKVAEAVVEKPSEVGPVDAKVSESALGAENLDKATDTENLVVKNLEDQIAHPENYEGSMAGREATRQAVDNLKGYLLKPENVDDLEKNLAQIKDARVLEFLEESDNRALAEAAGAAKDNLLEKGSVVERINNYFKLRTPKMDDLEKVRDIFQEVGESKLNDQIEGEKTGKLFAQVVTQSQAIFKNLFGSGAMTTEQLEGAWQKFLADAGSSNLPENFYEWQPRINGEGQIVNILKFGRSGGVVEYWIDDDGDGFRDQVLDPKKAANYLIPKGNSLVGVSDEAKQFLEQRLSEAKVPGGESIDELMNDEPVAKGVGVDTQEVRGPEPVADSEEVIDTKKPIEEPIEESKVVERQDLNKDLAESESDRAKESEVVEESEKTVSEFEQEVEFRQEFNHKMERLKASLYAGKFKNYEDFENFYKKQWYAQNLINAEKRMLEVEWYNYNQGGTDSRTLIDENAIEKAFRERVDNMRAGEQAVEPQPIEQESNFPEKESMTEEQRQVENVTPGRPTAGVGPHGFDDGQGEGGVGDADRPEPVAHGEQKIDREAVVGEKVETAGENMSGVSAEMTSDYENNYVRWANDIAKKVWDKEIDDFDKLQEEIERTIGRKLEKEEWVRFRGIFGFYRPDDPSSFGKFRDRMVDQMDHLTPGSDYELYSNPDAPAPPEVGKVEPAPAPPEAARPPEPTQLEDIAPESEGAGLELSQEVIDNQEGIKKVINTVIEKGCLADDDMARQAMVELANAADVPEQEIAKVLNELKNNSELLLRAENLDRLTEGLDNNRQLRVLNEILNALSDKQKAGVPGMKELSDYVGQRIREMGEQAAQNLAAAA